MKKLNFEKAVGKNSIIGGETVNERFRIDRKHLTVTVSKVLFDNLDREIKERAKIHLGGTMEERKRVLWHTELFTSSKKKYTEITLTYEGKSRTFKVKEIGDCCASICCELGEEIIGCQ